MRAIAAPPTAAPITASDGTSAVEGRRLEQLGESGAPSDQLLVEGIVEEALEIGRIGRDAVAPDRAQQGCLFLEAPSPPGELRPVRVVVIMPADVTRLPEQAHEQARQLRAG